MYKKDADGNPMVDGEAFLDFRKDILDYFDEDDTFIFNDTKVFPARLYGTKEKTDAKIEVFLLRELNAEMRSLGRIGGASSQDSYRQQALLRRCRERDGG